ncbi:MAG: hypothetical protein ACXADF_03355 [Candidatus Thorarchaeota archaeon]|jgi:hypothetical protein
MSDLDESMRLTQALIEPVQAPGSMKVTGHSIQMTRIPGICPKCLKPGNTNEYFQARVTLSTEYWGTQIRTTYMNMNIPIPTHHECKRGFRKNIGGTTRIWAENRSLCFEFKNPVYKELFTRINFSVLETAGGEPLSAYYERTLRNRQKSRKSPPGKCSRCDNELGKDVTFCPSCGLDKSAPMEMVRSTEPRDAMMFSIDESIEITCKNCGISMLDDPKIKICGRCGESPSA